MLSLGVMIIAVLVILGLCLGSFVNALVWRLRKQSEMGNKKKPKSNSAYSVIKGRSMCVHCRHELAPNDLIPVFSWIMLHGRCRYCKKRISGQYPAVELVTAFLFVFSYVYWPNILTGLEIIQFGLWLICLTGFMALIVYDLRWMILPNKIIFVLYGFAGLNVLIEIAQQKSFTPLGGAVFGVLVGGGIFYVLFQLSSGRWIGGGDVKLGFLLGALVASPIQALLVLFIASLLGCLAVIPLLTLGKASRTSRIPFGPFLIVATVVVMLFGKSISGWYLASLTGEIRL